MTQPHLYSSQRRTPSSPNLHKSSTTRTSRPVLHRRGTPISISKLGPGLQKRPPKVDAQPFEMAASFPNFCAMCEKQILVPDNSLLYCSESCRRMDSCKPISASSSVSSLSPPATPPATPPTSPPTIVAPMAPTRPQNPPLPLQSDPKPDPDPVLPPTVASDTVHYLPPLHGEDFIFPALDRRSSTSLSMMCAAAPLPPLAHSPSTVASSFSSAASASDSMGLGSLGDPATRPLPPRHNPCFSSSPGTKSVDLVVPHVEPAGEGVGGDDADSGSIFPASSAVWEDGR